MHASCRRGHAVCVQELICHADADPNTRSRQPLEPNRLSGHLLLYPIEVRMFFFTSPMRLRCNGCLKRQSEDVGDFKRKFDQLCSLLSRVQYIYLFCIVS